MSGNDYTSPEIPPLPALPGAGAWLLAACAAGAAIAVLLPFDAALSASARTMRLGGDVVKELTALQQYGQLCLSLACGGAVLLLDPRRRRRLLDWVLAAVLTEATVYLLATVIRRPRPGVELATVSGYGILRAYDLLSMPSRHAALAAVASVFLAVLYPRLWPLTLVLALTVCAARVVFGAHYPSDTLAGLAVGAAISVVCSRRLWGVRVIDWAWARVVDRSASPAWPALARDMQNAVQRVADRR